MKALIGLAVVFFSIGTVFGIAAGRLPGDTITNSKGTTLQFSVSNDVMTIELKARPACRAPRITQTEIVGETQRSGRMMKWDERWTVTGCGADRKYLIHFSFRGSVGSYKIEPPRA